MLKAFLSISYRNKDNLSKEINCIFNTLQDLSVELNIFVQKYSFSKYQEKEMMDKAFEEIEASDILIVEGSEKAVGVGIEVGYAKALGKTIIYLRHEDAEYSTTIGGSSSHKIVYKGLDDLKEKLINLFDDLIEI